jgi:hypothetical protein
MLHFVVGGADIGRYQEYKLGIDKYSWFDPRSGSRTAR